MNFLHLCAADHGGAGIAAWRMHVALRTLGHGSRMLVLDRRTTDPDVVAMGGKVGVFRLRRLLQKSWLKLSSRPDPYFQNQLLSPGVDAAGWIQREGFRPDVIAVHYISHFLAPDDVLAFQRASGAPVLWSLLDMGLMTGGCHYAWHCDSYTRSCGRCPALRLSGDHDLSARIWNGKHLAMAQTRGWVVAGSGLLARQAACSSLLGGRRIETVLLGVSPRDYRPGSTEALRCELGLAGAERVVFFGAQRFNQRRKGMDLLLQSLLRLADTWPEDVPLPALLSAGNAADFAPLRDRGFTWVDLGFVSSSVLAKAYAAADVFACPSIEDSGPMMINEAMMCGTPVVAFRMGVAPDLIEDGITGAIAEVGDVAQFAAGLCSVLLWSDAERAAARERCRTVALDKCEATRQLERFVEIAKALIDDTVAAP